MYYNVQRNLNIILTQLRWSWSFIIYYLNKSNIILNPTCRCGAIIEDTKHFFLDCPLSEAARVILINNLNQAVDVEGINVDLLTRGKSD